jgi:hypothetical protein
MRMNLCVRRPALRKRDERLGPDPIESLAREIKLT